MVQFSGRERLENWLRPKQREWSVVIATRASLRAVPLLGVVFLSPRPDIRALAREIILPALRGMAAPWVASAWWRHHRSVRADAAARAAASGSGRAHAVVPGISRVETERARIGGYIAESATSASDAIYIRTYLKIV
jgi:hypothetical protein